LLHYWSRFNIHFRNSRTKFTHILSAKFNN
jgi:hypothetical protein